VPCFVDKSCCLGAKPEAARTAALAGSRAPGGAGGPGQDQGMMSIHFFSCESVVCSK